MGQIDPRDAIRLTLDRDGKMDKPPVWIFKQPSRREWRQLSGFQSAMDTPGMDDDKMDAIDKMMDLTLVDWENVPDPGKLFMVDGVPTELVASGDVNNIPFEKGKNADVLTLPDTVELMEKFLTQSFGPQVTEKKNSESQSGSKTEASAPTVAESVTE